jgi:hypothetical protein
MVSEPDGICGATPLVRRPNSFSVMYNPSLASGPQINWACL